MSLNLIERPSESSVSGRLLQLSNIEGRSPQMNGVTRFRPSEFWTPEVNTKPISDAVLASPLYWWAEFSRYAVASSWNIIGDSMGNGVGAISLTWFDYLFRHLNSDVQVNRCSVSGGTSAQIFTQFASASHLWPCKTIIMASNHDGEVSETTSVIAQIVADLGHQNYCVVGCVHGNYGDIDTSNDAGGVTYERDEARNAALIATYGAKYLDFMSVLNACASNSAEDADCLTRGCIPGSLRGSGFAPYPDNDIHDRDRIHLSDYGQERYWTTGLMPHLKSLGLIP